MLKKAVVQRTKTLNELEILGRRLDAVRERIAQCGDGDSWRKRFLTTLESQLLNEWRQSIHDYDYQGYRYSYPCTVNAVRVITPSDFNSLNG